MYFSQLDIYTQTLAEKKSVNCEDTVKIGVFGFKPGVYPHEVQVENEPYGIDKNGQFIVDILSNAVSTVSEASNSEQLRAFNMERGYISSELESAILEQIVGVESLSTVQLFKRAQEKGINIVSLSKNTTKKVSDLKISDEDAKRLQAEIDAGNTIITMEQSITVGEWTGIGYIVETADQASQAFMISGKMNGGVCSSSVSVAAIIGIAIDEIWLVETVGLFIATLSAMTSLAFVPVATLVLCVIAIELMVFDIIETIANNYDYYMNGNGEVGTQVKINAAINVITFGVTKIGGAIISQAKNATNCAKYGKNVITVLKNSGFTTAEVNAQISKFSKFGCSQATIETLLKNPKCMFLGDDILKVIGKTGGSQKLLAELVVSNGDDFAKFVMNTSELYLSDSISYLSKYGSNSIDDIIKFYSETGNFDDLAKFNNALAKNSITDQSAIVRANRLNLLGVSHENAISAVKNGTTSSVYIQKKAFDLQEFRYLNGQKQNIYNAITNYNKNGFDVTKWTGRLSWETDLERMAEGEWMAIDSYLKDGHSICRVAEIPDVKTCDFIVDGGIYVEYKGMATKVLNNFISQAKIYASECVGTGSKQANKLVLDCTINDIEFSDEEIKSILSALHEGYPDLQVEIWTLNGKFS